MLIQRLQGISSLRNMRMTFISGDVHVGGLGRLYSYPKVDLRKDHRFMPQVNLLDFALKPLLNDLIQKTTLHPCSTHRVRFALGSLLMPNKTLPVSRAFLMATFLFKVYSISSRFQRRMSSIEFCFSCRDMS